MVEVVFGECEANSIKFAQNKQIIDTHKVICIDPTLDRGELKNRVNDRYRGEMVETDFMEVAKLIGTLVSKYQLGVSDWWYMTRINQLIEQGKIQVIKEAVKEYLRIIKSVSH